MSDTAFLCIDEKPFFYWHNEYPDKIVAMLFNNYSFKKKYGKFRIKVSTALNRLRILNISENKAKKKFEQNLYSVSNKEYLEFKDMMVRDEDYDEDYDNDICWVSFRYEAYKKYFIPTLFLKKEEVGRKMQRYGDFLISSFESKRKDCSENEDYRVGYRFREDFVYFLYTVCDTCSNANWLTLDISNQLDTGYYLEFDDFIKKHDIQWYDYYFDDYYYVRKALVFTEGTSDSTILEKTKNQYFKEYYDLIDFYKQKEIFKSSGGASFIEEAVISSFNSGYKGKILAIYDNDSEGIKNLKKAKEKFKNYDGIKCTHYPDRRFAQKYDIDGEKEDINGKALFLELYIAESVSPNRMPKLKHKVVNGNSVYKLKDKSEKNKLKRKYNKWLSNHKNYKSSKLKTGVNSIMLEILKELES